VGTNSSNTVTYTDDDFLQAFKNIGLESQINDIVDLYQRIYRNDLEIKGVNARKSAKYIMFDYDLENTDSKRDLNISCGVKNGTPNETLDFWCYSPEFQSKFISKIDSILGIDTTSLDKEANYGKIAQWPVSKFSTEKLIKFFKALS
jgi:hypothetical protein